MTSRIEEAQALVQFETDLPGILDEIRDLEATIAPIKKEIARYKAEIKAVMVDSDIRFLEYPGWRVRLVAKVTRKLNIDCVQKAISKTMWARIVNYTDPNSGKRPKRAYTETPNDTLTIDRVDNDEEVA